MLEHIERLKTWQALDLPPGIGQRVHQNRLLKIAREGGQMTPADLAKFEQRRCYATLGAIALEGTATVTDEIVDLHDRIIGKLFNTAKHKHQQQFQRSAADYRNRHKPALAEYLLGLTLLLRVVRHLPMPTSVVSHARTQRGGV